MNSIKTSLATAVALACVHTGAATAGTTPFAPGTLFVPQPADSVMPQQNPDFSSWRAAQQQKQHANVTDRILVRFHNQQLMQGLAAETDISAMSSAQQRHMRSMLSGLSKKTGQNLTFVKAASNGRAVMSISSPRSVQAMQALANSLMADPSVASAEVDPRRYLMSESQPWGISRVQADSVSDNLAANKTVCIIDSGYDINTPDLAGNQVSGTNDSGTGSWATPGGSHGTHVAGTIAAVDNEEGVVGVLPGQNINLHIIKVFNADGWGYSSDLVAAVDKCAAAGANVVNMSLGGASSSNSERTALQGHYNNGILLVAAAGNSGNSDLSYPASYDSVMSVAATDEGNQHAEFSQYTSQVEVAAPGEAILSTVATGDGRQGFITFNGNSAGDDRVVPHNRYVQSGGSYQVNNVNGMVNGVLATCSRSGSSYNCGSMSGKICVAERNANQSGSNYPEINAAKACADAGAAGIVVYSNNERSGLQNPFLVDASGDVSVPTASVNRALGQQLAAAAGSAATLEIRDNTDYAYYNGTSMATPHVSGVAALAWSKHPDCSAAQVRAGLKNTALDLDVAGRDDRTGYGLVQTSALVDYLANNCGDGGTGGGGNDNQLQNGVAKTGLSGSRNQELSFTMQVPADATDLNFAMSGGTGDADLYVKFGSEPTTSSYDCRPYKNGNSESCPISSAQAGTYYVKVIGYSSFSDVSLTGSYTEPGSGGGGNDGGSATVEDISASRGQWKQYSLDLPAGMSTLTVTISGGSGDADLYVREGAEPTTRSYDCRPYKNGNSETCTITNPAAGTWHIGLRAYRSFSGVTLTVTYEP